MRIRLVLWNLGRICLVLALSLVLPLLCSVYVRDGKISAFAFSVLITLVISGVLCLIGWKEKRQSLRKREGYALVAFSWVFAAVLGAMPFLFSGVCAGFPDALFESMSGFSTTGASIFDNIDALPRSILLWRALTHWLGGMGIVVLLVALVSSTGTMHLFRAESPGNDLSDRITARTSTSSQILWKTYIAVTVLFILVFRIEGMSLFDAVAHGFSTIATGGFSTHTASIGYFDSALIQWTTVFFMYVSGLNFAYFYFLVMKRRNMFIKSEEFKVYTGVIIIFAVVIAILLYVDGHYAGQGLEYTLRQGFFHVVSIITTTGFGAVDYNIWPGITKLLLFTVFFFGGCLGSTTCSMKIPRIVVLVKNFYAQLFSFSHPKAIKVVKLNGKKLEKSQVDNVVQFVVLFMALIFVGGIIMCFAGLDVREAYISVVASLTNVGPGFGIFGPLGNYAGVSGFGKIFLSFYMMLGRLELYTVLVLFLPSSWKK